MSSPEDSSSAVSSQLNKAAQLLSNVGESSLLINFLDGFDLPQSIMRSCPECPCCKASEEMTFNLHFQGFSEFATRVENLRSGYSINPDCENLYS